MGERDADVLDERGWPVVVEYIGPGYYLASGWWGGVGRYARGVSSVWAIWAWEACLFEPLRVRPSDETPGERPEEGGVMPEDWPGEEHGRVHVDVGRARAANAATIARLTRERDDARADADEYSQTVDRLSELLRGVADALKGPPGPLELHDWSDLPEVAAEARAEAAAFASCNRARQAAEEEVERLRVADEWTTKALAALFYLRGIDGDQLDRMIEEYERDADLLEADRG